MCNVQIAMQCSTFKLQYNVQSSNFNSMLKIQSQCAKLKYVANFFSVLCIATAIENKKEAAGEVLSFNVHDSMIQWFNDSMIHDSKIKWSFILSFQIKSHMPFGWEISGAKITFNFAPLT